MPAGLDKFRSVLTRINVHYTTVGGTDAVVDTFAVVLDHGFAGTPTDTLTALLRRAEPIPLHDPTVEESGQRPGISLSEDGRCHRPGGHRNQPPAPPPHHSESAR